MDFARTKGMATLALLLTLPVAALAQRAPAYGAASNSSPRADVVDGRVMITDIYLEQDGDGPSRAYLLEGASIPTGLTTLAGDVAGLLQSAVVPAGTYSSLRIVIAEGCLRTDRGQVFASNDYDECGAPDGTLRMPSYDASGLKVVFDEIEVASPNRIMSLTFDVSQAFGRAAGRSGWSMAPVIEGAEVALTAGVAAMLDPGTVSMPSGVEMGDFTATLLPATGDSSRVTFADGDGDGVFELEFDYVVPANGPFDVRLNGPDNATIDVSPATVVKVSPSGGELAIVDWLLTSVTVEDGGVDCPWWICGP